MVFNFNKSLKCLLTSLEIIGEMDFKQTKSSTLAKSEIKALDANNQNL